MDPDSKGTRKPNLGGRKAGRLHTRQETRNLGLKKIIDDKGPVPIRFEWDDKKTMMPLGDHASHWSNYLGELIREMPLYYPSWQKVPIERKAAFVTKIELESLETREYPSLIDTFFVTHTVNERLRALGSNTESGVPYTDEEINAQARKGKQRWHLPGVGRVLPGRARDVLIPPPMPPPQCTYNSSDVEKLKKKNKYLTKQISTVALNTLTETMRAPPSRSGKSPGKESLASFPLQHIPGDMSPGNVIPSDKSPGNVIPSDKSPGNVIPSDKSPGKASNYRWG
ncbi:hypothetical protein Tco_0686837 [Tanacetum coccineum]